MAIVAGYMLPHPPIAVHEIGKGEEKEIQDTLNAFEKVAEDIARLRPETIVLTSPHAVLYRDYFHISQGERLTGSFEQFLAPELTFDAECDSELAETIASLCEKEEFPAGFKGKQDQDPDHGTMVPLYFINQKYTDYKLVRIGLSSLSLDEHVRLGEIIRKAVDDTGRRIVFIASGDLSHCQKENGPYGYNSAGPEYDAKIMDVMEHAAFEELKKFEESFLAESMECGHRSFTIMGGAFGDDSVKAEYLSHEATFGVGYGIVMYHPLKEDCNI